MTLRNIVNNGGFVAQALTLSDADVLWTSVQ
ncbi:hypothetical protein [Paraburkholderia acidicola]